MKSKQVISNFDIYNNRLDLPKSIRLLFDAAEDARQNAYAPYSKFQVGAALLLSNDNIVIGNNQENAAYPSGLCAERVAIFHAAAQYPELSIEKIFISGTSLQNNTNQPVAPCGSCRQVISEYETKQKHNIEIYFSGASGAIIKAHSIQDLLPFAFNSSIL